MASLRLLKTRVLPVLFLVFFSSVSAWATHIFGLDFYYSYVSGNTYRIYLVIYGDCSGSAFPSLSSSTPQVKVYNGSSLFSTMNLAVQPPVNGIEVTPVCPSQINNTTCVNPMGTIPGIKKFVYAANVTLPGTSPVWRFVFTGNMGGTSAGRSTSITNVVMGGTGSIIQLTDTLNNTVYTNSSAYYTTIPTPFYCINRPASFNPGAVDVNSDSLVYGLVSGVDGTTGSNLTYIAPYTPTAPIGAASGTFSFSNMTGQLAFTPNIVQKSLVVYNVREFRGGVMVGTSQREMTVVVIASCSNTPPSGGMTAASAGTIVSPTQLNICNNVGAFNFQINPSDPEGDTIDMTTAGLPAGATFNVVGNGTLSPMGTFSWNTTGVAPGNYNFFITYGDRGCPITSSQTIAYTITVLPSPSGTVSVLSPATCVAKSAIQVVPGGPTAPYAVKVLTGGSVVDSFPSVTGAVADSLVPGSYGVTVTNTQNCTSSFLLSIATPALPAVSASVVQPLCVSNTGSVTLTATGGVAPYTYSVNSGTFGTSNVFAGLTTGTYVFHVKASNQCTKDTTITITQPAPIVPHAIKRSPMCSTVANGQVTLSATGGTPTYTYAMGSGSYSAANVFTPLAAGTYVFHIKDANGCIKDTTITLTDSIHVGAMVTVPTIPCNGGASSVAISGTGGSTGSYAYAYNSNPFGSTGIFSLTAGAYVLHVRDVSTCQFDTAITLTQPTPGIVNATPSNIACYGGANGTVGVSMSGGTPAYQYGTNGGPLGSSPSFVSLTAGTYVVRVQDANGCIYYDTAVVTQPAPLLIDSVSVTPPLCFGNTNGSLHIYAHGGTPALTYTMGSGAYGASAVMSGLASGTYILHVRDANGCTKDTTVTIAQPTKIIPSAIVRSPMCSTVANGQVTLGAMGGSPAYTYAVGSGSYGATNVFTPLAAGTYVFHIKDANGCIKDTTITLTDSIHVGAIVSAPTIPCNGLTSAVVISGTGSPSGSYTYAYNSNPFGSTGTFSLAAGAYVLHVREASTCQFDTTITLTQPAPGVPNATATNVACSGSATGSVSVTMSGGTPSYQYGINGGPLGSSAVFGSLSAGTYIVRVQDANGCIYYDTAVVTQPTSIVIDSVAVIRPLCFGNANGSLHIYAHGGAPALTYAMGAGTFGASPVINSLTAGTYVLHVRDANGCTKDTTVTIAQPTKIIPTAIVRSPMCSTVANGQVTLGATGGSPAYTYALGGGSYGATSVFTPLAPGTYVFHIKDVNGCIKDTTITLLDSIHVGGIVTVPTIPCNGGTSAVVIGGTGSPSGSYTYAYNSNPYGSTGTFTLTAGAYVLHVRDVSTCQFDTAITLTQPAPGIVNATPANIACSGSATGAVGVTMSGGSPTYLYGINGGPLGASPTFGSLPAGTYIVRVQDAHGCIYYDTAVVTQPTAIVIDSVAVTRPLCFGNANGSLHIYAHGGTPAYSYAVGSGAYGSSAVISGLVAGTYLLHVRDANGCTKDTTVTMSQPTKIIPSAFVRSPMCSTVANGQVTLGATGGSPAYTYAMGSGSYGAASVFTPLAAGTYVFHIKDANGCTKDTTITLVDSIHVGGVVTVPTIPCNGLTSAVVISGTGSPSGSYTYAYNTNPYGSTGTFSLTAGAYVLHVRDVSTCQFDTAITLTQPAPGLVNAVPTNVSCYGTATGSVSVSAAGGTPAYTYGIAGGPLGSSPVFGSLIAGTYIVRVQDANGCIYYDTALVTQPAPIVIDSVSVTQPLCFGNANGSLQIYAHGGAPALTYASGSGAFGSSAVMSGLAAGTYVLHVRDANGCTKDTTVSMAQPSTIIPSAFVRSPVCNTLANGKVTLGATGGIVAYTYAMGGGSYGSSNVFNPLAAGTYVFHIKDANGCTKDTTITLVDSLHILASAAVTPALCFGDTSGTLTAIGSGGTSPYSYALGSGTYGAGSLFYSLGAGIYVVHVKDNNGCLKDTTAIITQPSPVYLHVAVTEPTCFGYTNGAVNATATGGTPGYQYAYNYGAFISPGTFGSLAAGTANVQVKDANGCIHDTTFDIHQPTQLVVYATPKDISCNGFHDGGFTIFSSGGVMPYQYAVDASTWQFGAVFGGFGDGVYVIHVKDSNDCPADTMGKLVDPEPIKAFVDIVNPTCEGYKDGGVTLHGSGGVDPYMYKAGSGSYQADSVFRTLGEGGYEFRVIDANGCYTTLDTTLVGYPHIKVTAEPRPITCKGEKDGMIRVKASGGLAPFTYQMEGGTPSVIDSFAHLGQGLYTITVVDSHKCRKEVQAQINEPRPLGVTFTVVDNKCDGYENQGSVLATVTGGVPPYTYTWNYNNEWNTAQIGPQLPNGWYGVVVKDSNNCTIWEKAEVKYSSCCTPYIPNAFTPNGDGRNDVFRIGHHGDMIILDFKIYNRFGELVYSSEDPDGGWDGYYKGIKAELGTYYYYARIICGNDKKDKVIFMKGDVTLIQ